MQRFVLPLVFAVLGAACITTLSEEVPSTVAVSEDAPVTTTASPDPTTTTTAGGTSPFGVALYDVSDLVKVVRPGVVTVTQTQITLGMLGATEQPAGTGTGIVVNDDGHIVTNFHVIEGAENVFVIAEDGRQRAARVIGGFAGSDIAVLAIEDTGGLIPLPFGSSEAAEVGDPVIAIGNALGLDETQPTVSVGIVSAKGRTLPTSGGVQLEGLLQTDAAINSGNSGGPLLNARGEVIGINTAIIDPARAQNIGFSIPVEQAKEIIDLVLSGEGKPFIGVSFRANSAELARNFGLATDQGLIVIGVLPTSPAEAGGLRVGDIIVEIDGVAVTDEADLTAAVDSTPIGESLELTIVRGRQTGTVSVTIAER
jgi:S1-C subfamily serine protease